MSGEGLSVSFRRTQETSKSNRELLEEFQKIIYASPVTRHMKWYGRDHSLDILEHGDDNRQKFEISVYDSWYKDADLYESHEREDSFVSLARKFANDNALMYFPNGFPAEWIETETTDGKKCWNHYNVKPDDKNIDEICNVWYRYGIKTLQAFDEKIESQLWEEARDRIKQLMEKKEYAH